MIWSGIQTDSGTFEDANQNTQCLTDLNDCGKSFNEIADYIDEYWKIL